MAQKDKEDKQASPEAKALWEEGRRAHDAGNYARVRELDRKLTSLYGDTDLGRQAAAELDDLTTDPWAIYAGLGFTVLYLIGWAVGLA